MDDFINRFNWVVATDKVKIDSIGDEFVLLENPTIKLASGYPVKSEMAIAVICVKGTMEGTLNLNHFIAEAPCLFIVLIDQILQFDSFSKDFDGRFILMSKRFLENLSVNLHISVPLFLSVHDNPWVPLSGEDLDTMIDYYRIIQNAIRRKDNPNRIETIRHLTLAFFYGTGYQYHNISDKVEKSKQEILVDRFLTLVRANYKIQRGVDFYAGKLYLTPKYLSKVIRQNSGKTAGDWIEDYVILEAKALLKSSNMTIQQITDELNFSTQSFFGKYFKRRVGLSPKEYRG